MTNILHEFIAGWTGGVMSIIIAHPFDTIKVRQQNYSASFNTTIRRTYQYEGFLGFYRGVLFPMLVFGPSNSIFFGIYGNIMHLLGSSPNDEMTDKRFLVELSIASSIAGFVQTIFMCPVELLKTVMQASTETEKVAGHWGLESHTVPHKNTWDVMKYVVSGSGYKGLFRGFVPMIVRDVPTSPIYIITYQAIHRHHPKKKVVMTSESGTEEETEKTVEGPPPPPKKISNEEKPSVLQDVFAGGMAGIMSWIFVLPFDVVKTRIQADNPENPKYNGMVDCFIKSYEAGGYRVFFKGLPAIMLRAFPANAVLFLGYEKCLRLLHKYDL